MDITLFRQEDIDLAIERQIERLLSRLQVGERWLSELAEKAGSKMEVLLATALADHDLFPIPQYPIGSYRADFAFPDAMLVIEVDGATYHATPEKQDDDMLREVFIIKQGWRVMRFTAAQVFKQTSRCVSHIAYQHAKLLEYAPVFFDDREDNTVIRALTIERARIEDDNQRLIDCQHSGHCGKKLEHLRHERLSLEINHLVNDRIGPWL